MTSRRKKVLIAIAVIVCVVAVIGIFIVPRLVNVNRYRPEVAAYLESKTGKPVHIGHLELTLFPHLAIQIDNFSMGNPKGFPSGDFLQAQRIDALFNASALWNRRIVVESLIVKKPVIHLLGNTNGKWNFENPPKMGSDPPKGSDPPSQSSFVMGEISKITITDGEVTIANLLPSGKEGPTYFDGQGISCTFKHVNISALTTPQASSGPGSASVSQPQGSTGIIPEKDNPAAAVAHGTFHANSLLFGAIRATDVNSQVRMFPKQAYLNDLTLKFAGGSAKANAAFDFSQANLLYHLQTTFQKIDMAQLLKAFPSASGKMTGTMEGNLNLSGEAAHSSNPLSGLQGTGQVNIRNGKLPSLQLNKNLLYLVRLAGIGSSKGTPDAFSLISADLNFVNQHLISHKIRIVSNDVNVDASGNVALTGANQLNYTGVARVPAQQSGLTNVLATLSGATYSNGKLIFPFLLKGTVNNPNFRLRSTSSGNNKGNQSGNFEQGIMNLFGKKKKSSSTPPKP